MNIMAKFEKRLRKAIGNTHNALVLGTGFGEMTKIVEIFKTVFVIANDYPDIKVKNLIYRENFDDLTPITDITAIFVDRKMVDSLPRVVQILQRFHPTVLIEENEVIGRDLSRCLYDNRYQATEQQGHYHIWRQI